jgi:hypothetical protein
MGSRTGDPAKNPGRARRLGRGGGRGEHRGYQGKREKAQRIEGLCALPLP